MAWVDHDLTALSGGTPIAEFGIGPDGYAQGDGSQHVNFVDANNHVHELYRGPDPAAQWVDNDLTALAGGTPASGDFPLPFDGYSEGDGSQHVNFVDGNLHVHELYRGPDPAAQWVDNDLTALAGGTPEIGGGPLDGYSEGDGSQAHQFR